MGNKIYVGNISWDANSDDLRNLFSEAGDVTDAVILTDRDTGRSRGFGFVTMATDEEAKSAIEKFEGHDFLGRNLKVNEAREREERPPRRDFGGGGGGGGGRGRGRGGDRQEGW